MKKQVLRLRIFICLANIFLIGGFFVAALNTKTVFIGIALTSVSIILLLVALMFALKMYELQNKRKEDRIEKLEKEVEQLKKK